VRGTRTGNVGVYYERPPDFMCTYFPGYRLNPVLILHLSQALSCVPSSNAIDLPNLNSAFARSSCYITGSLWAYSGPAQKAPWYSPPSFSHLLQSGFIPSKQIPATKQLHVLDRQPVLQCKESSELMPLIKEDIQKSTGRYMQEPVTLRPKMAHSH
jgi:hypothetical protein